MIFSSIPFVFGFLPIALIGFFVLGRFGRRAGASWLIVCSFYFYGYWTPVYLPLLMGSIAWNYVMAGLIFAQPDNRERRKLAFLWIGIGGNLALLGYYKYWFPVMGFLGAHGIVPTSWEGRVLLPLGISFFSFTQIGYLVDSYDRQAKERGPLSYLLFVTFFPHLIAGPVLHHREIMPQFSDRGTYRLRIDNLGIGTAIFIFGLVKKVLIADPLGYVADAAYAHTGQLGMLDSWVGSLSYMLQLYFDFSGYSDMAIGLGRMFNVTFPVNFNSPYKATSIIDYWSRWHMTLTRYLTLLLFNPVSLRIARARADRGLSTSRKAMRQPSVFAAMLVFPTFLTLGLSGVWHGAGLNFVVFGFLHAIYLTLNHAWRTWGPGEAKGPAAIAGAYLLTMGAVLLGSIFFRADSAGDAVRLLAGMGGGHGDAPAGLATPAALQHIVVGFLICILLPNTQQIMRDFAPILERVPPVWDRVARIRFRPSLAWSVVLGAAFVFATMRMSDVSKFLYFDF